MFPFATSVAKAWKCKQHDSPLSVTCLLQDLFRGQKQVPQHHHWLTSQTVDYPISKTAGRTVWTESKSLRLHTHSFFANKEITQTNIRNKIVWCKHIHAHIYMCHTQGLKSRTTGNLQVGTVSKRWSENQAYLPVLGCSFFKHFLPKHIKAQKTEVHSLYLLGVSDHAIRYSFHGWVTSLAEVKKLTGSRRNGVSPFGHCFGSSTGQ